MPTLYYSFWKPSVYPYRAKLRRSVLASSLASSPPTPCCLYKPQKANDIHEDQEPWFRQTGEACDAASVCDATMMGNAQKLTSKKYKQTSPQ
jgi:hypothetical protein